MSLQVITIRKIAEQFNEDNVPSLEEMLDLEEINLDDVQCYLIVVPSRGSRSFRHIVYRDEVQKAGKILYALSSISRGNPWDKHSKDMFDKYFSISSPYSVGSYSRDALSHYNVLVYASLDNGSLITLGLKDPLVSE